MRIAQLHRHQPAPAAVNQRGDLPGIGVFEPHQRDRVTGIMVGGEKHLGLRVDQRLAQPVLDLERHHPVLAQPRQ